MKQFFTKIIFALVCLSAMPTVYVLASEVQIYPHKTQVSPGEEFLVDFFVHTDQTLNALEGTVLYPQSLLKVKEIRDGASMINLWVDKPGVVAPGEIKFSGITPGGFTGPNVNIFTIVFSPINVGGAPLSIGGIKLLLNDGLGTQVVPTINNTEIKIVPGDSSVTTETLLDTELPEDFTPLIDSDPNIYDGKLFLVFSTQDKLSGIHEYKVREGSFSLYKSAESPFLLKDQTLSKKIFVKAIDKSGNERVAVVYPKNTEQSYRENVLLAILITVLLTMLVVKKINKWRRKRKSKE